MTDQIIKPYKKEKEGKLQRLPVRHSNNYWIDSTDMANSFFKDQRPKTNVIIHHGALDQRPLEMIKKARMDTNPFIKRMRENAAKND